MKSENENIKAPSFIKTREDALKFAYHLRHKLLQTREIKFYLESKINEYLSSKICEEIHEGCVDIYFKSESEYKNSNITYEVLEEENSI